MKNISVGMDDKGNLIKSNILLKVTKKEYADDIRAGKLYMKSLSYFRSLEQKGVGDDSEGFVASGEEAQIVYEGQVLGHAKNWKLHINCFVFCTLSVEFEENENGQNEFIVPSNFMEEFMFDGNSEYVMLMINRAAFIKRVERAMTKTELGWCFGNVEYTDDTSAISPEEWYRSALRKRKEFAHQHECRLIVEAAGEDYYVLNIGDISDITEMIPLENYKGDIEIGVQFL